MSLSTENVLHHHGIIGTGDTLTDNAREAGVILICHGCGTVTGIDMSVSDESARIATRDSLDLDDWNCCEDENVTVF